MADDKNGREKQARDADRRQRERDVAAQLERMDEPEPPIDESALGDVVSELERLEFPATGADVVATAGDRKIEAVADTYELADLVPETDVETFDSPEAVRDRVQRPTVATAMKRVLETSEMLPNAEVSRSQRGAYEKTFRALRGVDADDDDEPIAVVADWIVEHIEEKGKLPGSRAVRRQAAKHCRSNGYSIRNDEWLGI